jgi:hypothetical protein
MRAVLLPFLLVVAVVGGLVPKRLSGGVGELALRRLPTPEETASTHGDEIRLYLRVMSTYHHAGGRVEVHAIMYNATHDPDALRERRLPTSGSRLTLGSAEDPTLTSTILAVSDEEEGLVGVYGHESVSATLGRPGVYQLEVTAFGRNARGRAVTRRGQRVVRVVEGGLALRSASGRLKDGYLEVELHVDSTGQDEGREMTVHAVVYGVDRDGVERPACWIGGRVTYTYPATYEGRVVTALGPGLEVDERWLALAGVSPPLVLREVRLVDRLVPLHMVDRLPLYVSAGDSLRMARRRGSLELPHGTLPEEMRYGRRPTSLLATSKPPDLPTSTSPMPTSTSPMPTSTSNTTRKSGLVLVHGYCVVYNPFKSVKELFRDPHLFLYPGASLTNDQFARLVGQYAEDERLDSFGIVAHSQGGLASLHLHSHYWTNLEVASGGRLIQTVGSPWLGSALAGDVARLGTLFGIGCGYNYDLTRDGARIWLADISPSAVRDVYYHTTQAPASGSGPHYCNGGSELVEDRPNDGVADLPHSLLEGATHVSHSVGECHTPDMAYVAQTQSRERAVEMDGNAAR